MKILSRNESQSIAREADELCSIIEKYSDQFHKVNRGHTVTIQSKVFRCICSDKNVIYKVRGNYGWYLKFSLKNWVKHEIAGAESVNATLAGFEGYQHAEAIRASLSKRYTLYSAVKGKSFNKAFLQRCLLRPNKIACSIMVAMENLGRSLARLHSYNDPGGLRVLNPDTLFYLRSYLKNINQPSSIVERIAKSVNQQNSTPAISTWIHGNIKSEDIFIANSKICILDFGTCGSGSPYEDLTNLCTYMMLFRTVPLFPWRTARQIMSTLLDGYAEERNCNKDDLARHITFGIYRYYLKNVVLHNGISTLSGMPVQRSRIDLLVIQLLEKDYEAGFEGVRLYES